MIDKMNLIDFLVNLVCLIPNNYEVRTINKK